jgi:hypothetical protein
VPCWVFPGVHTGVLGHEHAAHAQLEVQYSVPYVLHGTEEPGEHTPWPLHVPPCQVPIWLQVSVSLPQLPHPTTIVCPAAHEPVH